MKEWFISIVAFLAIITGLVLGIMELASRAPEKTSKDLCLENGGVPIMNWNNSDLKDCKFK